MSSEYAYCVNTDLPQALWKGSPTTQPISDADLTDFCYDGTAIVVARILRNGETPPTTVSRTTNMVLWYAAKLAALFAVGRSGRGELLSVKGIFPPKLQDIFNIVDGWCHGELTNDELFKAIDIDMDDYTWRL